MAYLENPLKFTFVPSGQTYSGTDGSESAVGTLLFDEVKKTIKVRGVEYGLDSASATNLANSLTALKNAGLMTENNGAYSAVQLTTAVLGDETPENATIQSLFATVKGLIDAINTKVGDGTGISSRLTAVETAASNANAAAQAAQQDADSAMQAANNRVQSVSAQAGQTLVTVTTSPTSGAGPYSVVVGAGSDLTNALAAATAALPKGTSARADAAALEAGIKSDIIGTGTVGTGASDTWTENEEQTLSHLRDLIKTLSGGSSVTLTEIQNQINNILDELDAVEGTEQGDALNTILDAYRTLRGTNALTVDGQEKTTFQGIIDALEGLIDANSTADQEYAAAQASNAQSQAISAAQSKDEALDQKLTGTQNTADTANNATIWGAKKDAADALAAAQAAASSHSTVQGVTGAMVGQTNYVMVSEENAGSGNTAHKNYVIQSTKALDDAIANLASQASAAQTAAHQTITWEVVGQTGTSGS